MFRHTTMKSVLSAGLALGLLAAAAVLAPATGASAQKRVAVARMEGKGGALVRSAAQRALKERDEVVLVPSDEVSRAASRLRVSLDSDQGMGQVSMELGIAAWVRGGVEKDGRRVAINLEVLDGSNGQTLGVMSYTAKNPKLLARAVENNLWKDLGDLIEQGTAPSNLVMKPVAEEEPTPQEEVAEEEPVRRRPPPPVQEQQAEAEPAEENDDDDSDGERPSPFDIGLAFAAFSRSFDYNDDLSSLRTYDLKLGPTIMLKLHWYPAAHFDDGVMAHIGLELRGAFAFGLDSELGDTSFPTSSRTIGGGLRARLPFGDHEAAAIIGAANQTFAIDAAKDGGDEIESGIPGASYTFLRLGAELRFAIGDSFAIGAAAAFLPVLSSGEIEDWFPRASGSGIEGELNLGYALTRALEVTAAFGLQRFAFTLNPKLEDVDDFMPIAGGALDQYLWGTVGMRLKL